MSALRMGGLQESLAAAYCGPQLSLIFHTQLPKNSSQEWAKAWALKAGNLNFIPGTHILKEENEDMQIIF